MSSAIRLNTCTFSTQRRGTEPLVHTTTSDVESYLKKLNAAKSIGRKFSRGANEKKPEN